MDNLNEAITHIKAMQTELAGLRDLVQRLGTTPEPAPLPEPALPDALIKSPTVGKGYGRITHSPAHGFSTSSIYVLRPEQDICDQGNLFIDTELTRAYAQALDTLLLLRRQPGTEVPSIRSQYQLEFLAEGNLVVARNQRIAYKLTQISPCFKSDYWAQRALSTVGLPRIKRMFEVLHGVTVKPHTV